ncbi:MAG: hypothetical protein V4683_08965 [Bacteroidota bacterium]
MVDLKSLSDICVKCGMCCDGTLFERGTIVSAEDRELAISKNLEVIELRGKEFFKLPCPLFQGCCTIYDQDKPKVCSRFYCDPLKKVIDGELSLEVAHEQVMKLLNLRNEIMTLVAEFEQFKNLNIFELQSEFDLIIQGSKPDELKKYGIIILKLFLYKEARKVVHTRPTNT